MSFRSIIASIALIILVSACFSVDRKTQQATQKKKPAFPLLIDAFEDSAIYLETNFTQKSNYKPITYTRNLDTIIVNYILDQDIRRTKTKHEIQEYMHYHRINIIVDNVTGATDENIKVIVDTTTTISKVKYKRFSHLFTRHKAYPTYIINTSLKDTVILGYDSNIDALLEAKNRQNEWKRIESLELILCRTGRALFVLPKKDTIITATTIFKGNFKTKLRLRLGKAYSNEFEGFINEQQLSLSNVEFY